MCFGEKTGMGMDLLLEETQEIAGASLVEVEAFEDNQHVIRKSGLYKNQINMADDFDTPLEDFKEYM